MNIQLDEGPGTLFLEMIYKALGIYIKRVHVGDKTKWE